MTVKKNIKTHNVNNNTNKVSVNVNIKNPEETKKKDTPNWYTRTILGGIITLLLSIAGYYLKRNLNSETKKGSTELIDRKNKVEPIQNQ